MKLRRLMRLKHQVSIVLSVLQPLDYEERAKEPTPALKQKISSSEISNGKENE
jgi:hypothetical protein